MLIFNNSSTNPYFNLATEEYILKNFNQECFMLWRNKPAIIVGKNQNTLAEINIDYVRDHNIPVVRRLSGGGAVFHDLGNLNFTFIMSNKEDSFSNYLKFTKPIIEVLQSLSIGAELKGRNDLVIDGRKFSGNAQYVHKDKILHHGTLLFSSSMVDLTSALKVSEQKIKSKGIKSIRSRVTNISEHLASPLSILDFTNLINNYIIDLYEDAQVYKLTNNDIQNINSLVNEKYNTWDWNYGSSPKYSFHKQSNYPAGNIEVNIDVQNGLIKDIKIYGDFFGKYDVKDIESVLIGEKHEQSIIKEILSQLCIENYFANISLDNIIESMF